MSLIVRRFPEPLIVDTPGRVGSDVWSRRLSFALPVTRNSLNSGRPFAGLDLAESSWARLCAVSGKDGTVIEPNDPIRGDFVKAANRARAARQAWRAQRLFHGGDLADHPESRAGFARWLKMIGPERAEATMCACLCG